MYLLLFKKIQWIKKPTKLILNKLVFYKGMEVTDIETWILWMYLDLLLNWELCKFLVIIQQN